MDRRLEKIAAAWLCGLYVAVAAAGFFAPVDYAEQDRSAPLAPPTTIHFMDPSRGFHLRPFVCAWEPQKGEEGYREDCSRRFPVRFLVEGTSGYRLLGIVASRRRLFGVDRPGAIRLMGTDVFGRDQFSRFLYGGQVSLGAGLLACVVSLALALFLGAAAGYYRGPLDDAIMGAGELSLALPWLYLLLAARALLPLNAPPRTAFLIVALLLGLLGWAGPARLIRGTVLSATEREYVLASRGFGASDWRVLRTHVLPQLRPLLATQASLLIPRYILAEVVLSFLGLGVGEPGASWGNMLAQLRHYGTLASDWWLLLPAALLAPTFLFHAKAAELTISGA